MASAAGKMTEEGKSVETMDTNDIRQQLQFLQQNSWIYDFQITRFFVEEVWTNIPQEWKDPLLSLSLSQLRDLPYGHVEEVWPESLKNFIRNCIKYCLPRQALDTITPVDIDQALRLGMSPKKEHEVSRMVAVVHQVASMSGCDLVLDVGSGLGYLGQTLNDKFQYNIIGFESQHCHTVGADRRSAVKANTDHIKNVTFQLDDNPESVKTFEQLVLQTCATIPDSKPQNCTRITQPMTHSSDHQLSQFFTQGDGNSDDKLGSCSSLHSNSMDSVQSSKSPKTSRDSLHLSNDSLRESIDSFSAGSCGSHLSKDSLTPDSKDSFHSSAVSSQRNSDSFQSGCDSLQVCGDNSLGSSVKSLSCSDSLQTDSSSLGANSDSLPKSSDSLESDNNLLSSSNASNDDSLSTDLCFQLKSKYSELNCDVQQSVQEKHNLKDSNSFHADEDQFEIDKDEVYQIPGKPSGKLSVRDEASESLLSGDVTCQLQNNGDCYAKYIIANSITIEKFDNNSDSEENSEDRNCDGGGVVVPRAVMVGLHCCGDLTPTVLSYYKQIDCVRALCCISCCYHRMKFDDSEKTFENFPLSSQVSQIYREVTQGGTDSSWRLNTFSMRLAAQETRARWRSQTEDEHNFHVKNVGFRGILELYIHKRKITYGKLFRKIARKSDFACFSSYLDAAYRRLDCDTEMETDHSKQELLKMYEDYKDKLKYIEPITALQVMLQPVLESLIYKDRQLWLMEHGLHCDIVPVFDESLSPRNLALVSVKDR